MITQNRNLLFKYVYFELQSEAKVTPDSYSGTKKIERYIDLTLYMYCLNFELLRFRRISLTNN